MSTPLMMPSTEPHQLSCTCNPVPSGVREGPVPEILIFRLFLGQAVLHHQKLGVGYGWGLDAEACDFCSLSSLFALPFCLSSTT